MPEEQKEKVNVTLPAGLHTRVKSVAPLRGMNIERAYRQALERWLGDEPEVTLEKPTEADPNQALLDALRDLLNSQHPLREAAVSLLNSYLILPGRRKSTTSPSKEEVFPSDSKPARARER